MLVDKMGDNKDKIRELAIGPMVEMWRACPAEVERAIREQGLVSKNTKLKETSLEWLSRVYAVGTGISIKPFTGILVGLLEDASDVVREKAKFVVVDLFRYLIVISLLLLLL